MKSKALILVLTFLLSILLCGAVSAFSDAKNVSKTNSYGVNNPVVNPGDSIQNAIDQANPGDIVTVNPGTYKGSIYINKPLTLKANGIVKVKPTNSKEPVFYVGQTEKVTIEGFILIGMGKAAKGIIIENSSSCAVSKNTIKFTKPSATKINRNEWNNGLWSSEAIVLNHSPYNTIIKNIIANSFNGIALYQSSYNKLTANTVSGHHDGFEIHNSNYNIIKSNIATLNDNGLELKDANYNNIMGNNFSKNGGEGYDYNEGSGMQIVEKCSYNKFTDNTINYNKNYAFNVQLSSNNNLFTNNIIRNNGHKNSYFTWGGIVFWLGSKNNIIKNCTITGNQPNDIYTQKKLNNKIINTKYNKIEYY